MEFHVSRQARDYYQFDQSMYKLSGNVVFADFHATRLFAQKINQKRDLIRFPERAIRAGQLNAMGLIDEIMHYVIGLYRKQQNSQSMSQALAWLELSLGKDTLDETLRQFLIEFPPLSVYQRSVDVNDYFDGATEGISHREIILEELMMLWVANKNPAFAQFLELFDDTLLKRGTAYMGLMEGLNAFFEGQPHFGPDDQNLLDMLRSPAIAEPHSLTGQLDFIRRKWGYLLGDLLFRILRGLDMIAEEEKSIFLGPGPARVYEFGELGLEAERFSPDKDWMPGLVLLAKNIHVWLDQLSKQTQEHLHRLDHVPDGELDRLARWGFKGLWLIGLWERSPASQRIKQLRGNQDAVASAYSLFDYQIASDLGGEEAYQDLRERAWQRGIRLASDMVPNHMGIDSRWVVEHPDWFISLNYSAYPSYTFNGQNLSWDDRVGIYLEDHYYDSTDAAVVFKRVDHWTGDTRFIYHGNDGTSMPWNDTAQLNYLKAEVRESVIQTILHVARKFPIIRFDAAMTLAKKHYQRLWFPEPGTGGAIPSRAEHGLVKAHFDAAFPVEFWREVVDRVAQEVPDTLLLAEAFWLMEGYFVRTLGMHRVYNSAFMNMLRDEKNQEYRLVIKNTLEFDPEILKRYVNFMNNPDERTAVDQFGKGDKYFGICTMMATMPGLPMFGHGQIEGYSEKYGMEFRRAYWDERPDSSLVERHEREIFPLLRKRYLFAQVHDFLLYDFFNPEGQVNEDVFAFSNRSGDERALVVYHNRYAEARGWIRSSAAFSERTGVGDERRLTTKNLAEGLGLQNEDRYYCIFRDQNSGLEYIRNNRQLFEEGLYIELAAYKVQVLLDFRQVEDNAWSQYAQLAGYLNGRGVPRMDDALKELILQPVLYPFRELVNAATFRRLISSRVGLPGEQPVIEGIDEVEEKTLHLLGEIDRLTGAGRENETLRSIASETRREMEAILRLQAFLYKTIVDSQDDSEAIQFYTKLFPTEGGSDLSFYCTLLGWAFTHHLGRVMGEEGNQLRSRAWFDEWLLGRILSHTFQDLGMEEGDAWWAVLLIEGLIDAEPLRSDDKPELDAAQSLVKTWLASGDIQKILGINRHQGILWFNQEAFDRFLGLWLAVGSARWISSGGKDGTQSKKELQQILDVVLQLKKAEANSGYQVERLLDAVSHD